MIIVVAKNSDGHIGLNGDMPWGPEHRHEYVCKQDLSMFRFLTEKRNVIMGSKTWHSLPKSMRPLPNRCNVVISSQEKGFHGADCVTPNTDWFRNKNPINVIIGGGRLLSSIANSSNITDMYITTYCGHRTRKLEEHDQIVDFPTRLLERLSQGDFVCRSSFVLGSLLDHDVVLEHYTL